MSEPVLKAWDEQSLRGDEIYRIKHSDYGVVVCVERYKRNAYKIKIKNPNDSAVDRLSIGPDLTRMIHPQGQQAFPDEEEAEHRAAEWAVESVDEQMLASMSGKQGLDTN